MRLLFHNDLTQSVRIDGFASCPLPKFHDYGEQRDYSGACGQEEVASHTRDGVEQGE
ncbi:hypothetical protein [Amycolatopsis panacis]|uniref:hypothetical protein n=1 Tax=Amycolatopsis panacis TaxID=2340917 RepID=UPI001314B45E|nr:hypothetical protein [Amycolatopsis panacis]